jgi:hypothetical protein
MPWSAPFDDPIELPNGRKLITLKDAASYITRLPKTEHDAPEWQAAIEALMPVVDLGGPTMFARIGVMRGLNRHVERVLEPDRKDHRWGKRNLARDRDRFCLRQRAALNSSGRLVAMMIGSTCHRPQESTP